MKQYSLEYCIFLVYFQVLLHSGGAVYPDLITDLCEDGYPCLFLYQDNYDKTWQQAYDLCRDKGLYLLPIHNQAVQDKVRRLLQQSDDIRTVDRVWTAGRQLEDAEFKFRNGEVFSDISPDDIRSEENCVMGQLDNLDQGSVKFVTDNCAELYAGTFVVCQSQTQDCADGYASGDYCYRQHGDGSDWFYNKIICLANNSDLIQSSIMGDSGLLSYLTRTRGRYIFLIGAARHRWTWDFPDAPDMLYYNWFPDAERQDLTSGCLYVDHESGDRWRQTPCSDQLSYFICVNVTSDRSSSTTTTTTVTSTATTTTTSTTTTDATTTTTIRPSDNTPRSTATPSPSSTESVYNSITTETSVSDGGDFNKLYMVPICAILIVVIVVLAVMLSKKRRKEGRADPATSHVYQNAGFYPLPPAMSPNQQSSIQDVPSARSSQAATPLGTSTAPGLQSGSAYMSLEHPESSVQTQEPEYETPTVYEIPTQYEIPTDSAYETINP